MVTSAHPDDVVRCGYNPPTIEDISEIWATSTLKRKEAQFCIFFDIDFQTFRSWQKSIRQILRQDSGQRVEGPSAKKRGTLVYAEPGARLWFQLEPSKENEYFFISKGIPIKAAKSEHLKAYFKDLVGSEKEDEEVEDQAINGKRAKRVVPSAMAKMHMLSELVLWEANCMKADERLWSEVTERDVRKMVPINPEYMKLQRRNKFGTPSQRKAAKIAINFKDCYIVIHDAERDFDVKKLKPKQHIIVNINDVVAGKPRRQPEPEDVSWTKFESKIEAKWTAGEGQKRTILYETEIDDEESGDKEEGTIKDDETFVYAMEVLFERAERTSEKRVCMRCVIEDVEAPPAPPAPALQSVQGPGSAATNTGST
ncbi:hypothetical protein BDY17DRAFT_327133 [Neohortaea acidophila]|uniref:Uncharacterized protein n=1 Tax=Neohortaea acidophila TaxID=245834 RepID=A0A6A6PJH9_9PEZI|nr:uncharacterized protein BDY17DRAFT_327133 [Neohortaea acidophila]KAF2480152.1 hypothetical protein BDY17DRAFT_327133 [Neohortaea acidophila]